MVCNPGTFEEEAPFALNPLPIVSLHSLEPKSQIIPDTIKILVKYIAGLVFCVFNLRYNLDNDPKDQTMIRLMICILYPIWGPDLTRKD